MSDEQFKNNPAKLPQNVTGWIEVTDKVRDSFMFQHGSVWLMAVPVYYPFDLKSWDYELHAVTVDCDGTLRLTCNDSDWEWDWSDVTYIAPLRK